MKPTIFAIRTRKGEWQVCTLVPASEYSPKGEWHSIKGSHPKVWSRIGDTAWICTEGAEDRAVPLE